VSTSDIGYENDSVSDRRAIVVGAGLVGLGSAALLARAGWSVVVLERAAEIKEVGAAIGIRGAGLEVLRRLGVLERLDEQTVVLRREEKRDAYGNLVAAQDRTTETTSYNVLRTELLNVLLDVATAAGVEVKTDSEVAEAFPNGRIVLESGSEMLADVIVAADGFRSKIRYATGLEHKTSLYSSGVTRVLLPREDEPDIFQEFWSGRLRVGIAPTTTDINYAFLSAPETDARASAVPIDPVYWSDKFPGVPRAFFDRLHSAGGIRHAYPLVKSKSWVKGRIALVGDAATALPPTLGIGASVGLTNAYNLATTLEPEGIDVVAGLSHWDAVCRPIAERVQRRAGIYNGVTVRWPRRLEAVRKPFLKLLRIPAVHGRVFRPGTLMPVEDLTPR
jgi:2-polyprenyl-6-methoxyphenol hydroxylase-like FAD-dependent oxidoreductase